MAARCDCTDYVEILNTELQRTIVKALGDFDIKFGRNRGAILTKGINMIGIVSS